jgi:L-asparagine transporter-like permease
MHYRLPTDVFGLVTSASAVSVNNPWTLISATELTYAASQLTCKFSHDPAVTQNVIK